MTPKEILEDVVVLAKCAAQENARTVEDVCNCLRVMIEAADKLLDISLSDRYFRKFQSRAGQVDEGTKNEDEGATV